MYNTNLIIPNETRITNGKIICLHYTRRLYGVITTSVIILTLAFQSAPYGVYR